MARGGQLALSSLTITPLLAADTHVVPVQPQFLQSFSDTLGDHLTAVDGFDDLLNTPLSLIDPETSTIDALGTSAASAVDSAGAPTPATLDPIAHDLATFQANGDTILTSLGVESTPPTPPTPAPAPAAGGGGGGGGGGNPGGAGGGGGSPDYCLTSFCYFPGFYHATY